MKKAALYFTMFIFLASFMHGCGKKEYTIAQDYRRANVGNVIEFGHYPGEKDKSLDWIVLERDEEADRILVITKNIVSERPYQETNSDSIFRTWENCSIRSWLKLDFVSECFEESEKDSIVEVENDNPNASEHNIVWSGIGGKQTKDIVFLLDCNQFEKYVEGSIISKLTESAETNSDGWWLRSSAETNKCAMYVDSNGKIQSSEIMEERGIRPAMWINIREDN